MPLDLPLSALRKHAPERILDVDTFLDRTLAPGTKAADAQAAPAVKRPEGGAQPSERP